MERPGHGPVGARRRSRSCWPAVPSRRPRTRAATGRGSSPSTPARAAPSWPTCALVARRIDVLAPNWYGLDLPSGGINARAPDPEIARLARRRGFRIWPVVNAQTDGEPLLSSAGVRSRVVSAIAATAARHRYPGVTLDLEGLLAAQRDDYTALVGALGRRLHRAGRRLAVYVPRPPLGDLPADPPLGGPPSEGSAAALTGRRWPAPPTWCSRPATTSIGRAATRGPSRPRAAFAPCSPAPRPCPAGGSSPCWGPSATTGHGRAARGGCVSTVDAGTNAALLGARLSRSDGAAELRLPGPGRLVPDRRGPAPARGAGAQGPDALDRALLPGTRAAVVLAPLTAGAESSMAREGSRGPRRHPDASRPAPNHRSGRRPRSLCRLVAQPVL